MQATKILRGPVFLAALAALLLALSAGSLRAHCNAENGPVAEAARAALEKEELAEVAIWVGQEQEDELRAKYERCLGVFAQGGDAAELAERYFVETAVRLHREAEGMPYTGLKEAGPLPPDIAKAEKALETGNLEPLSDFLSREMKRKTQALFRNARQTEKHKQESVEKGRDWVDAYVRYVIYVHGLHQTIKAGPKHGMGE